MRLFDAAADDYDAARPSYPAAVYESLERRCGGLSGRTVADGGAGTGIVARQLLERGAEVVAFDPGIGVLRRAISRSPGLRAVIADGASVPLASHVLDLACFGQSWHWVDQAAGAREMSRVLKPGGWWAAWWSHAWADQEAWFDEYYTLLETRCPGMSRHQREVDWCSEAIAAESSFAFPGREIVGWERQVSVESWLTDLRSHSYVIDLGGADRSALLADARRILLRSFPAGAMAVPYRTRIWTAQRL